MSPPTVKLAASVENILDCNPTEPIYEAVVVYIQIWVVFNLF